MSTEKTAQQMLNGLLRCELAMINQYFLHARMLNNFGYDALGKIVYQQSIKAMKRADALIERIFLLKGLPNLQDLGRIFIAETAQETILCDLKAAAAQEKALREAVFSLEKEKDFVSRALVSEQLTEVEEHRDWLETQRDLIENLGLQNYLQSAV